MTGRSAGLESAYDLGARPRRGRRLLLAVVAVVLIATAAGAGYFLLDSEGPGASSATPVIVARVERRTLVSTIVTRGLVQYPERGELLAAAPGRVTAVFLAAGDIVDVGIPILAINARPAIPARLALPFYRELKMTDEGPDVRQLKRYLVDAGYGPAGDLDDDFFSFATYEALRRWQEANGYPVDGVLRPTDLVHGSWPARLGALQARTGEFVQPGEVIATFTAQALEVRVELSSSQRLLLREGTEVIVEVGATGATARGRLTAIVPNAPPTTERAGGGAASANANPFAALLGFATPVKLPDGTQVKATFLLQEVADALAVPLGAVVAGADGKPAVQVVEGGGRVRLVPIVTGLVDGAYVEVRSGLLGGESIIVEVKR